MTEGKMLISISPEEELSLEPLLSRYPHHCGKRVTLDYYLGRWTRIVSKVEIEYRLCIYDYTNDLSCREVIQEIIDYSSLPLRQKIVPFVNELDERFLKSTQEVDKPLPGPGKLNWWWYRIPLRFGSELKGDLENEGFIK